MTGLGGCAVEWVSSDPFIRLGKVLMGTRSSPGLLGYKGGWGAASGPEGPLRFEGCQGKGVLGALP